MWFLVAFMGLAFGEICTANILIGACDPPPLLLVYGVQFDATYYDRIRFYGDFSYLNSTVAISSCVSTGEGNVCPSPADCANGVEIWEFEDSLMPVDSYDIFRLFEMQVCDCQAAKDAGATTYTFQYDTGRFTCDDVRLGNYGTCTGPQATECAGISGGNGGRASSDGSGLDHLLF